MNPTPSHKPRWRPRFSLRTLLIGVLLIAGSWTATVVWGVPSIGDDIEWVRDLNRPVQNFSAQGQALAPCVVHWVSTGSGQHWRYDETWLWCFGLKWCIQANHWESQEYRSRY